MRNPSSSIMGSIMEYNGGAVVAMRGKGCVAIASDKRLGQQFMTVSMNFPKVFRVSPRIRVGLSGLASDVQTMISKIQYKVDMYQLEEHMDIAPRAFVHMVSHALYERRFGPYFTEPVIAGVDDQGTPFIYSMDLIGCINFAEDFCVSGTCSPNLYGICEALYEPDLEPDDLFETISQALLNAVDRDALSGWGAVVHIITKDKAIVRELKARMD